jgi:thioredoxin 1
LILHGHLISFGFQFLFMKKYKTGSEFKASLANGEVVALFYASWCPDCSRFCPKFISKFEGKPNYVMVAIDEDEDIAWDEFKIDSVPSVLVFKGKKISTRYDWDSSSGLDIEKIK